jgi:hypothetical protein
MQENQKLLLAHQVKVQFIEDVKKEESEGRRYQKSLI